MRATRTFTTLALVGLLIVALGAAGCAGPRRGVGCGALPPDLPSDPEACSTYCRVWVPPVYRDVPRLKQVKPGHVESHQQTVCRTRFQDVCVKPAESKVCRTPDYRCEQTVVQVKPGGYVWKRVPGCTGQDDCWKYCYEPPCYQWCDRTVTQEGIQYCTEVPPEYKTVAWTEPVVECRQQYVPAEYEVEWVKEVYRPGYWAWSPNRSCEPCDCPVECPTLPRQEQPCLPPSRGGGVPATN